MPVTVTSNATGIQIMRYLDQAVGNVNDISQHMAAGKRIIKASDDPVDALTIDRVQSEISAINQSLKNTNYLLDTLSVADQGLQGIANTLHQMSDLAYRSATEKLTEAERRSLDQEFRQLKNSLTKLVNDTEYNGIKILRDMQFYGVTQEGGLLPGAGGSRAQELGPNYFLGLGPSYYLGKLANDPTTQVGTGPNRGGEIADRTIVSIIDTLQMLRDAGLVTSLNMQGVPDYPPQYGAGGLAMEAEIQNSRQFGGIYAPEDARKVYYLLNGIRTPQGRGRDIAQAPLAGASQGSPGVSGPGMLEQVLVNRANLGATYKAVQMTQENLKNMLSVNTAALERLEYLDMAQAKRDLDTESVLSQSAAAMLPYANFMPSLALSIIQQTQGGP